MVGPSASEGRANRPVKGGARAMRVADGARLSQEILRCANGCLGKLEFLRDVSTLLMDFCACDAIEIRLSDRDLHYCWKAELLPRSTTRFERVHWMVEDDGRVIPANRSDSDIERICRDVACQRVDLTQSCFTAGGSYWTGDSWQPMLVGPGAEPTRLCVGGHYRSLIVTRFIVDDRTIGILQIKSERPDCFTPEEVEFCEEVAQALGLAVADRRAQAALRERIKELTCLYGIAQVAEEPELSLEGALQRIVELLPPAWQYPGNAVARILIDEHSYAVPGFRLAAHRQAAEIAVNGRPRGLVEVVYTEEQPEFAGGVFLVEEEKLIRAVAREVALIVERKEAAGERSKLQQQLIHADRLATIGQLAAGVAHELNEPLGSILGFAQLVQKSPDLPEQAMRDVEKIVSASLYAREVIKKLMVFARQVPATVVRADLNQVIEEGLRFLEARCTRSGVRIVRRLSPELPEITADRAQLTQVLVNVVVNAVQAMPDGGTLTITTRAENSTVCLTVKDTGTGMPPETLERAFLPFFTTKDVNEGTGLGLSVVHGIVTSHGGSIDVKSEPGQGTRFEVRLPVIRPSRTPGATEGTPHG